VSESSAQSVRTAIFLFVLTFISMLYVGCMWAGAEPFAEGIWSIWRGYPFAVPLMAILLSHELGHYFVARYHRVDVSPPFFIPMPFALIGTFGAVINMRGPVSARKALLDIGAAGPLMGFVVTLPVLIYGLNASPVEVLDPSKHYFVEGRSLLYAGLIYWLKGSIPSGQDIMLTPTALAGWAGLLVTMMNLVPVAQLDGGHVAYALFGERQDRYSRYVLRTLLLLALAISAGSMFDAFQRGLKQAVILEAAAAGLQWGIWWLVLTWMSRANEGVHPPTAPSELSPARRIIAWVTLSLFVLLFMPTWMREI